MQGNAFENDICPVGTIKPSVGNSHRSAGPRPTTFEEDRELFVDFSSILCLWFEIQGMRTYNFLDWVSNTGQTSNISGTLVDDYIHDHSDVVGASPVGTAPTISSFFT